MTDLITFFVPGNPAAQGRPRTRVLQLGRRRVAQIYNPHNADEWKARVEIVARPYAPKAPLLGPVRLTCMFMIMRPEAHYRTKAHLLKPAAPLWHYQKPDGDNYAKALLDALTAVRMWHDDCQVCDQRIQKIFTNDEPGCLVSVQSITTEPIQTICRHSESLIILTPSK